MNMIVLIVKRSYDRLKLIMEQKSVCLNKFPYNFYWFDCGKTGKALYLLPGLSGDEVNKMQERGMASFVSTLTACFVVYELRDFIIREILRYNYFYFRQEERDEIVSIAKSKLEKGMPASRQETYLGLIERRTKNYLLEENQHLNIEGFVYFRLKDYQQELKGIVDDAVESYLMEKEYREFVRLLKYFLEIQQPKIEMVHLSVDEKGQFQITDNCFTKIDPREWEEFDLEEFNEENDYEDILVSMLVSLAPRQIMLHQKVLPLYPRAVDTLRRIFDKRLLICNKCANCRHELNQVAKNKKKNL